MTPIITDMADFSYVLGQIRRSEHLEPADFLALRRFAGKIPERTRLLNALIDGYAAHQSRIEQKNVTIAELRSELAAKKG